MLLRHVEGDLVLVHLDGVPRNRIKEAEVHVEGVGAFRLWRVAGEVKTEFPFTEKHSCIVVTERYESWRKAHIVESGLVWTGFPLTANVECGGCRKNLLNF